MQRLSFIIIVIALGSFWVMSFCAEEFQRVDIKSMRCTNVSEKYIHRNYSCFAKSYSRTISTGNIRLQMKRPITDFYVMCQLFFKYGTIYREVLHLKRVNWCQITSKSITNKLITFILDIAIDSAPAIIHECPYKDVIMINATFKTSKVLTIFPRGDYKLNFIFIDEKNETIVIMASVGSVISSYIETFG